MEEHATWLIDVPQLSRDLSVAAAPNPSQWNRRRMRELVDQVFATSSSSTQKYLSLIRCPQNDEEARLSAIQSVDTDLPRWFLVVMAPALKPAAAIHGRSSMLPKILEAIGWTPTDAQALLLGDPLAELARTIGLSLIGTELEETKIKGWLSLDRISALGSKLSIVLRNPTNLGPAGRKAAGGYWAEDDARVLATQLLNDAQRVVATAEANSRPLRIVFDF